MDAQVTRLVGWYHEMWRIRLFEETLKELYRQNLVPGSIHLCIGQEAIPVGACAALRSDDMCFVTFRGHGHCVAKGADCRGLMAEILKRRDGCCGGKGGSLHLCDVSVGIMEANGIVAAGIPHAVGAAFAAKYKNTDRVAVAVFGEGATNQGAFHEAANLAAVWMLPVVFLCENNQYSEMTPISKMVRVTNPLADRGAAYGIPAVSVDGNDVEAVFHAVSKAVARGRAGGGPSFIEAHTYRLEGHMYGDTGGYRSGEEVEAHRAQEPLKRLHQCLLTHGVTEERMAELRQRAAEEMQAAAEYAKASPEPSGADVFRDVYA